MSALPFRLLTARGEAPRPPQRAPALQPASPGQCLRWGATVIPSLVTASFLGFGVSESRMVQSLDAGWGTARLHAAHRHVARQHRATLPVPKPVPTRTASVPRFHP